MSDQHICQRCALPVPRSPGWRLWAHRLACALRRPVTVNTAFKAYCLLMRVVLAIIGLARDALAVARKLLDVARLFLWLALLTVGVVAAFLLLPLYRLFGP